MSKSAVQYCIKLSFDFASTTVTSTCTTYLVALDSLRVPSPHAITAPKSLWKASGEHTVPWRKLSRLWV